MCIVIDACTFSRVFAPDDVDFSPVRRWVASGKGKIVMGGTKYACELSKLRKYIPVIAELSRQGRVITLENSDVDAAEKEVKKIEPSAEFDDPHIVAIIKVSGCKLVCTLDARSDKYLTDRRFYEAAKRPSIYRSVTHGHLLRNSNIVGVCVC